MRLTDLLSPERVGIKRANGEPFDKEKAIGLLATLIGERDGVSTADIERALLEREQLQSTGIGEGVAIPHGALPQLSEQVAALLIVPDGVDFQAIDDANVTILFGVITPKRATGEHLKTLARVSRLLRNKEFRARLIGSADEQSVFDLINTEESEASSSPGTSLAPATTAGVRSPSSAERRRRELRDQRGKHQAARSAPPPMADVTVAELLDDSRLGVKLTQLAGASGLGRPIRHPRVQKSGLALAGHFYGVVPTRVQVLGETELSYLDTLTPDARGEAARGFFSLGLSCVVVTRRDDPSRAIVQAAEATGTPLFMSEADRAGPSTRSTHCSTRSSRHRPHCTASSSTSSESVAPASARAASARANARLELVLLGLRLVADDVVRGEWRPPGMVFGAPADVLRHHVEVRGLGPLNIKDLFGVTAVRERNASI